MMNLIVAELYAKTIQKNRYTIDKVPAEYREIVQKILDGESIDPDDPEPDPEPEDTIYGAIVLPNRTIKVDVDAIIESGVQRIVLDYDKVFTAELVGVNEYPKDVEYSVLRVENIYNKYRDEVSVTVDTTNGNALVTVNAHPSASNISGYTMLRIDLKITSSNYDEMYLTLYLEAK